MVDLTSRDDIFQSTVKGELVRGLGGNDTISASKGGNILFGGDGNDTLNGGDGNDELRGDDTSNSTFSNRLSGGRGNDRIYSYSLLDKIMGGAGNDVVLSYASTTSQTVDGGTGSDTLYLYAFAGTNKALSIDFDSSFTPLLGGAAAAVFNNFEQLFVVGGTGSNNLRGGAGSDTIINNQGRDSSGVAYAFAASQIGGRGGNDVLSFLGVPGTGAMRLNGGAGTDTLDWFSGNTAAKADYEISAVSGRMESSGRLFAILEKLERSNIKVIGAGNVDFTGFVGSDTFSGSADRIALNLDAGNDEASLFCVSSTANGGSGNDNISTAANDGGKHFWRGGSGNDQLSSGSGKSKLFGNSGNDALTAHSARSSLYGGSGDDVLTSIGELTPLGNGGGMVDGGVGADSAWVSRLTTLVRITEDFSALSVTLFDGTVIRNCEAVQFTGGDGGDVLKSSNDSRGFRANHLDGSSGNDVLTASANGASLWGGSGTDVLQGARSRDVLVGGSGKDMLKGGGGDDLLEGGIGKDTLRGGLGQDQFYFASLGVGANNRDKITDFSVRDDTMFLSKSVFGAIAQSTGQLKAKFYWESASGTAHDGNDRIIHNTKSGIISYDADGNGKGLAVEIGILTGTPDVSALDFWLY